MFKRAVILVGVVGLVTGVAAGCVSYPGAAGAPFPIHGDTDRDTYDAWQGRYGPDVPTEIAARIRSFGLAVGEMCVVISEYDVDWVRQQPQPAWVVAPYRTCRPATLAIGEHVYEFGDPLAARPATAGPIEGRWLRVQVTMAFAADVVVPAAVEAVWTDRFDLDEVCRDDTTGLYLCPAAP